MLILVVVAPCHLLLCYADLDAGSGHRWHGERLCHVAGAVCGAPHAQRAVELAPGNAGKEVSNDAHEPQIQHRFVALDQKLMPLTVLSSGPQVMVILLQPPARTSTAFVVFVIPFCARVPL